MSLSSRPCDRASRLTIVLAVADTAVEFWRRPMVMMAALLAVGLLPALVNGYPFYFEDSAGYTGHRLTGTIRSDVPRLALWPLWPVAGVWSLPLINTAAFAWVMHRFLKALMPNIGIVPVILVMVATTLPFYLSLISPDAWFILLYLAVLLLVIDGWSVPAFAMAAIAVSGHGAHPFILAATSPLIVMAARCRLRAASIIGTIVLAGIVLNMVADLTLQGRLWPPKIGWAVVASKILNDVPEAYDELCAERPDVPICRFADEVRALTPHAHSDNQYLWTSGLQRSRKMDMWDFNRSGRALFVVAITRHPWEFLRAALMDVPQLYLPHRGVGFAGFVDEAELRMPDLNLMDHDTLTRRGLLRNRIVRSLVLGLNLVIYGLAILSTVVIARRGTRTEMGMVLVLVAAVLCSDFFFASLSGSDVRYHMRSVFLYGLIVLIAWNRLSSRETGVTWSGPLRGGASFGTGPGGGV